MSFPDNPMKPRLSCQENNLWERESLAVAGLHPKLNCMAPDLSTVIGMINAGHSCAFLPQRVIESANECIAVNPAGPSYKVYDSICFQPPRHAEYAASMGALLAVGINEDAGKEARPPPRIDEVKQRKILEKGEMMMRTKLNITEGIFPMPVLMIATYNADGSVNVMNAAWGTMLERDTVALNLTESHKTVKNIKARGAFTVSIADAAHVTEADFFGVESGNRVSDKLAASGLTASKAECVDAPVINEFPICLECEFIEYQDGKYGCGVIGKVVNVTASESVMVNGKIDISLVNAIAFDPYTHGYYKVTERVGEAFKDGLKLKK